MLRGFDKKGLRRNAIVKSLTLCLLILFVFIPTRGESLVCAGLPERYYSEDKLMIAPLSAEGYRSVLVVFAKFRGEAPGDSTAPAYARDLFDPDVIGSFSHFYTSMSFGALTVAGEVLEK